MENLSKSKLEENFKKYDLFGVAGTSEVKLQAPALWHIMGGGLHGNNLHGSVAHIHDKKKSMTSFGPYLNRVIMIDVSDVYITHASPGLREFTKEFNKGQEWFLQKHKG